MCTGRCAKFIGKLLFPLGVLAIIANLLLYFPNGDIMEAEQITDYVWYFHGIVGAGLLVFLPAFMMIGAGGEGCCANRCGMFLTVILSALGTVGAAYCVVISAMGLVYGPKCDIGDGEFIYPFRNNDTDETDEENYLLNQERWSICQKPENVVLWNVVLFSILLGISAIEAVLCLIQVINGVIGVICGTCLRKRKVNTVAA